MAQVRMSRDLRFRVQMRTDFSGTAISFGMHVDWVWGGPDRARLQYPVVLVEVHVGITGWARPWLQLNHVEAVSGHEPDMAGLQHPIVRTGMPVGWLGKDTVPARTTGGQSQPRPKTHWSVQDLPLGGCQIEALGELLCEVAVPAGKHKNQGKEQPKPGQVTAPASIHVDHVWRRAKPGQFITSTGRSENQDSV